MIWGSSTIDPRYSGKSACKPWNSENSANGKSKNDSQYDIENADLCLNCPLEYCDSDSKLCLLNCIENKSNNEKQKRPKRTREEAKRLDNAIKDMLYAGWRKEVILEELGITITTYYDSRKRLLKRGEITDGRKQNGRW